VWEIHHGRGNEEKKNKMEDVPDEKNATTKKSQCFWLSILRKWNKHISLHFYSIFFILVEAGYLARPSHQATHECTGHAGFTFFTFLTQGNGEMLAKLTKISTTQFYKFRTIFVFCTAICCCVLVHELAVRVRVRACVCANGRRAFRSGVRVRWCGVIHSIFSYVCIKI